MATELDFCSHLMQKYDDFWLADKAPYLGPFLHRSFVPYVHAIRESDISSEARDAASSAGEDFACLLQSLSSSARLLHALAPKVHSTKIWPFF